jgi:hypothetical protein
VTQGRVAVIVPAFDEAATVAAVVRVARQHPAVAEVVVVDDGSRDETAQRAREAGARVVCLPRNRGKAQAMDRGVAETSAPLLLFVDADIVGLRLEVIELLVAAATAERHDMFVAMVARKRFAGWLGHVLPVLGGTRIVRRELWTALPQRYKRRFRIEIALNHFASRAGLLRGHRMIAGLGHVMKEKKRGFWRGMGQRVGMIADIVSAIVCLQLVDRWTASERVLLAMHATRSLPLRFPLAAAADGPASEATQPSPRRRSRR